MFYTRTNFSESKGKLRQLINKHCVVTLDASVRSQQMLPVTTTDHKVAQCDERTGSFDSAAVQCREHTLFLRPDQWDYGKIVADDLHWLFKVNAMIQSPYGCFQSDIFRTFSTWKIFLISAFLSSQKLLCFQRRICEDLHSMFFHIVCGYMMSIYICSP